MKAPAYRADDLKVLALHWLRRQYPDALLVPELCVGHWGSASIDVAAITEDEIIGVEVKGDGDSPARLERQFFSYGTVASRMWLLPSPALEARCWKKCPPGWGRVVVRDGRCVVYRGEKRGRGLHPWQQPETAGLASVPAMLGVLWAGELRRLWADVMDSHLGGARAPAYAGKIRSILAEKLPLEVVRPFLCRALRERPWGRGGNLPGGHKIVYRPGDPLPVLETAEAAE